MSLRALWIFDSRFNHIFSRRYPNVEARLRRKAEGGKEDGEQDAYSELPSVEQFLNQLRQSIQRNSGPGHIWTILPGIGSVVVLERVEHIFVCVPAIEHNLPPNSLERTEITITLAFVEDLSNFFFQLLQEAGSQRDLPVKLAELNSYLNYVAPFGSMNGSTLANAKLYFRAPFPEKPPPQKQPAWKPFLHKGKSQIQFTVKEKIRAIQYDTEEKPDVLDVRGSVICKAELEGIPDITINFTNTKSVDDFSTHPCVQAADISTKKLIFSPPLDQFDLCDFHVKDVEVFPLRGFFQMKEIDETTVRVLVQLKLDESINNSFEYCQLRMPFSNRGLISSIEITPTTGVVSVSPNKKSVIWHIGQKFMGRNREAALPGTVYFQKDPASKDAGQKKPPPFHLVNEVSDPMCTGQTAFVTLHFKILEESLSRLSIDPQNLLFYPSQKPKVTVTREVEAGEYIIWNSLGNARAAHKPQAQEKSK